ncbi:MAG: Xaa-Pro peptidase family protein [Planctomycetota bacterium]
MSMAATNPAIPEPYASRIQKLRAEITRRKLDAYCVQNRTDQYWLTGFTGEDGAVVVTQRGVTFLTDGRFDEAANREAPWAKKVLRKQRNPQTNVKEIKKLRVGRLGFNPDHMTFAEHKQTKKHGAPWLKLVEAPDAIRPMRIVKTAEEVERIKVAIRVAEDAFNRVREWLRPGATEREVAARLAYEMQMLGAQGEAFPSIVAVGPNAALPHYEPGGCRVTEDQPLLIDWGAKVNWYGSDLTRVLWLGPVAPEIRKIFDIVRAAQEAGIKAVRAGAKLHDVDKAARDVIEQAGYGKQYNHALGHGLGLAEHEPPRIGQGTEGVLQAGMVVTVEPGIYLPSLGGVRLEDDVLVTDSGCEKLTTLPVEFK